MAASRFKEAFYASPWLKPFGIRFGLSVLLLAYVVCGAGMFMGVMKPSAYDRNVQVKMEQLRNDTAMLMVNEMAGQEPRKAAHVMTRFLVTYERELERSRSRSSVDELLLIERDEKGRRSVENPGASYENSLYFTLSLLTATTSGNMLRLPDGAQVLVLIYTLIGAPLAFGWLVLMGRSMAQVWILLCVHSCTCGLSSLRKVDSSRVWRLISALSRRNRSITPESLPDKVVPTSPPHHKRISSANSASPSTRSAGEVSIIGNLPASERNVLVQPENVDEYLRLVRGDLILPLWTLSLFFLLFGVFGASVASVSHEVSFMTAFFYGYLIFTTIGGITPNLSLSTAPQAQYLSRFSGEDVFAFIVVQQHRAVKEELLSLQTTSAKPEGEAETFSEVDSGIFKTDCSEKGTSGAEEDEAEKIKGNGEKEVKAQDEDGVNMEDRITLQLRQPVQNVLVYTSSSEARQSVGISPSLSDNRRSLETRTAGTPHLREITKTSNSIESIGREDILGSAMSKEDIRNEPEPDVMQDITDAQGLDSQPAKPNAETFQDLKSGGEEFV
ncbi:hypothetical protein BIW11_05304 [Tropilaelaps mercedesae]|uniref:Potassium channel subfamily K member 18-like n=1 Tax=Tropilaelaps mercedesae TaxID=418985 RepID=A0A1V9Y2Z1_9ACAR|nr:hypothetical protein BIW11_05304 [Tropilaelaps mercedesae]